MKKLLWVGFFIIITFVFTNIGYTYYRTNLLPFQSLLLECKAAFIKYPYRDWRKDNTTAEEWEHYDSAKKNYPVIKFPSEFKIKFNYKNTGKFIDAEDFFKDRSFSYYTKNEYEFSNGYHTHFNINFPIPNNDWNEEFAVTVGIKKEFINSESVKKLTDGNKNEGFFFPRIFLVHYLVAFFNDNDAYYNCEEIE